MGRRSRREEEEEDVVSRKLYTARGIRLGPQCLGQPQCLGVVCVVLHERGRPANRGMIRTYHVCVLETLPAT